MSFKGVVKKTKTPITEESLQKMFPQRKGTVTPELAKYVDDTNSSEDFNGDEFLETLVSYRDVMLKGAFSIKEYVTAVKFCSYLIAEGDNTIEAYKRARADDQFVKERIGDKSGSAGYNALTSAASRYRQSKLVRELLTVSQMPLYLMFQGERYRAVEVLSNEMQSAAYSKDRISAADKLLTHVKPPENFQVELEVGPNQDAKDMHTRISEQLAASVALQKSMLAAGVPLDEAQRLGLREDVIDAEIE